MPKEAFTARWVQALKPTSERVEYFDETLTGLVLRIEPSGRKSWRVAFRANNRWRRMNIGAVSLMDLATARTRAREILGGVASGQDPADARRADREAGTFAELANDYIEKHAKQQKRSWEEDYRILYGSEQKKRTGKRPHVPLVKLWGHLTVKGMTRREIRPVLDEIAARAPIIRDLDVRSDGSGSVRLVGKGGKTRHCPLWPTTMTSLRALSSGRSPDEPVFRNRRRAPITRFVVHATVARYVADAAIACPSLAKKAISPHVIRHTTATHLLRAGVDINTIRAWLGHVSIDTTNVYAEVDLETKAQMLAACGSFTAGNAPTRRWRDDPSLMQFLRSL